MKCSWNEEVRRTLTPRFALAIAASLLLHGLLVGSVSAPEPGQGVATDPLRTVLLPETPVAKPAISTPSIPASPRYYRTRELDVVPGIMTRTDPEYPDLARTSGKLTIRLFIDERGTVEHVTILRAEPPGIFEASARRAFLAARFTPGMKAGVAVRSQVTLQVDYTHPR